MTIQEKKRKLQGYAFLLAREKNLEMEIEALRESQTSVHANIGDGMPHTCSKQDLSDYIVSVEKLNTALIKAKTECNRAKLEIKEAVDNLQNNKERQLMYMRYIRKCTAPVTNTLLQTRIQGGSTHTVILGIVTGTDFEMSWVGMNI